MGRHRKRNNIARFFRELQPDTDTVLLSGTPPANEPQQQPVDFETIELVVRTPSPPRQFDPESGALSPERTKSPMRPESSVIPLAPPVPVPKKKPETYQQATQRRVEMFDKLHQQRYAEQDAKAAGLIKR